MELFSMGDFSGWIQEVGTIQLQDLIGDLGDDPKRGAITTFTGVTRADSDHTGATVTKIKIETWEEKSTEVMQQIAEDIGEQFSLLGLRIVHLDGIIKLGDPIVFIVISSAHRQEAFSALEEAIHRYKNDSPVWKKEIYSDGSSKWITTAEDKSGS